MPTKPNDAISRSDRMLVAALGIILATASAAIGASLTYHPSTDKVVLPKLTVQQEQVAEAPAMPVTDVVMTQLLAEHKCLSEVLYYEARGEGPSGQKAIAEVVFHRMNHGGYGPSICSGVYDGQTNPACQSSSTCTGEARRPKQMAAWRQSEKIAAAILTG